MILNGSHYKERPLLNNSARNLCTACPLTSPDHLVGAQQDRCWQPDADCFGSLEIEDKLEFRGLLDRNIGRFGALEYLVGTLPIRDKISPMDRADVAFWLSIVATATSFALALLKGFEFYTERRIRFDADVRLTSSEDIGNTIVLLNKSNIPATISYFDLAWVERRSIFGWPLPFTRKVVTDRSPIDPPYGYDETIPPHCTHQLRFTEVDHFDWGKQLNQHIYLRLWLAGRNAPIWIWVTGPDKS
jgi:hypothetical protein